jgi:Subtilase family
LEAVRYIFARAGQLNRPCVINLSQGDNIGPHDGTSLLERGIDAELGAPGRAFVKSAGNEGASSRHAEGRVTDGGVEALILNVDVGDPTPEVIDIWYGANDKLGLSVTPPNGNASSVVAAGQNSTITLSNGNKVIVDSVVGDPRNGQNRIFVMLLPGNKPTLTGGNWTLTLHGATIAGDGGYHAWIERGSPAQTSHFVSAQRSTASTISIPGTAKKVITAGSFATNGTSAGNLSTFSSRGPTRDGRRAPTVCAPGQEITSVQAQSAGSNIYAGMMGTSMAAPHVTVRDRADAVGQFTTGAGGCRANP